MTSLHSSPPSPSSRPSAVPLKSEGKLLRCGNLVWAEPAVLGRPRSLGRWPPQGRPTLERDSQDFFVFPTFLCWCLWRLFGNAVQTITVVVSAPNHSSRPHAPLEIVNRCPLATCQMKSCFMVIKSRHFASCTLLQRELGGALGPEMFLVKEIAWHRNGWTNSVLLTNEINRAPSAVDGVTGPEWKPGAFIIHQKSFHLANKRHFSSGKSVAF